MRFDCWKFKECLFNFYSSNESLSWVLLHLQFPDLRLFKQPHKHKIFLGVACRVVYSMRPFAEKHISETEFISFRVINSQRGQNVAKL
jgi:hypothetical protein